MNGPKLELIAELEFFTEILCQKMNLNPEEAEGILDTVKKQYYDQYKSLRKQEMEVGDYQITFHADGDVWLGYYDGEKAHVKFSAKDLEKLIFLAQRVLPYVKAQENNG